MPSTENLANLLADHPFAEERDLLCTVDRTVTVGEAKALVAQLATELTEAGVQPGEGVAVRLPSDPDLVVAMLAIWSAGAVFVPLNDRSPESEVRHVLDTVRPAAVLDESGLRRLPSPLRHEPDIAFVTWTSGTTGPPKAILQSHSGYLELLDRVLKPLRGDGGARKEGAREPTPNLVPVSVALNAGIYNVCFGLRAGAAVVLMPRFATGDFAELVHRYQVRSTVLPPAAMVMLDRRPGGDRPLATALRAQHHGSALAVGRSTLHGAVRRDSAEQLRAGRGGGGRRLDGRGRQGAPREAGGRRATAAGRGHPGGGRARRGRGSGHGRSAAGAPAPHGSGVRRRGVAERPDRRRRLRADG